MKNGDTIYDVLNEVNQLLVDKFVLEGYGSDKWILSVDANIRERGIVRNRILTGAPTSSVLYLLSGVILGSSLLYKNRRQPSV